MADEISDIFKRNLKMVDDEKMRVFVENMHAYYCRFKFHRDNELNYEGNTDYQNELFHLSMVNEEDYWIYSPQFKKTVGLMISKLFKTKITDIGLISPVAACQDYVYFDKHMNRWIVSIESRESEPGKMRIMIRFPRSNSILRSVDVVDSQTVSDPQFKGIFWATGASVWYDD